MNNTWHIDRAKELGLEDKFNSDNLDRVIDYATNNGYSTSPVVQTPNAGVNGHIRMTGSGDSDARILSTESGIRTTYHFYAKK